MNPWKQLLRTLGVMLIATSLTAGCGAPTLGHRFDNPTNTLKVGYDREQDVVAKMGQPYRRTLDTRGRVLLTYVWADGQGGGETCLVALNEDGIVALVDVTR